MEKSFQLKLITVSGGLLSPSCVDAHIVVEDLTGQPKDNNVRHSAVVPVPVRGYRFSATYSQQRSTHHSLLQCFSFTSWMDRVFTNLRLLLISYQTVLTFLIPAVLDKLWHGQNFVPSFGVPSLSRIRLNMHFKWKSDIFALFKRIMLNSLWSHSEQNLANPLGPIW